MCDVCGCSPDQRAGLAAILVALARSQQVGVCCRRSAATMRNFKRKTQRGTTSLDLMKQAADAVIKEGKKIKTVARDLDICHTTLRRFVMKTKAGETPKVGYKSRQILTQEQEEKLTAYILYCSKIFYGLLPDEVRKLAYQCAVTFKVPNIPKSWIKNEKAGADWFTGFIKRNPTIAIRTPEATSAGRAAAFNRHNVEDFFNKLGDLLLKHNFPPSRIWNLDETGVTTVLKPKKICAEKGTKQVGAIVSAERGTLVTVELAVSAAGNTIPPMFVFPRLKYKDIFLRDSPPESIGAGNSSGWMTVIEFLIFLDHFIKYTKPTPKEPVLLLLDNHSSHINIEVILKARENSVIMLSFPPHCTHRLQPLDVGVNGPLKAYCAKAQDYWLRNNPGKTMSIYEIPGIVKFAWPLAATPMTIMNAFKKSGICPYNPSIFTDDDFAPSFATDRPMPAGTDADTVPSMTEELKQTDEPQPGPSNAPTLLDVQDSEELESQPKDGSSNQNEPVIPTPSTSTESISRFSPAMVNPFPKAAPRLPVATKRRIRKSAVLTDTPEKDVLAEEQSKKKKKKNPEIRKMTKKCPKGKGKGKGKSSALEKKKESREAVKRKVLQETESEDEDDSLEWYCIICCDSYSNSRPREQWVECIMCKNWAHSKCLDKDEATYVCPNCESEEENDAE